MQITARDTLYGNDGYGTIVVVIETRGRYTSEQSFPYYGPEDHGEALAKARAYYSGAQTAANLLAADVATRTNIRCETTPAALYPETN